MKRKDFMLSLSSDTRTTGLERASPVVWDKQVNPAVQQEFLQCDFPDNFLWRRHVAIVPDLVSRIRDVVLVRRILVQENPRRSGFWSGEGMGRGWKWGDQFMSNLRPRWTGSYHIKEGFQVSKRKWDRNKGETKIVCQPIQSLPGY